MHISEFRIENFKSFKNVTIHLNQGINLLTGGNNTGKSTLLEAISLWHECYEKLLQQAGKATKALYKQGDYTFGAAKGAYFSYNDIISVRSPSYADIFHNLNTDETVALWAKICGRNEELWVGFRIKGANGDNYLIFLDDYDNFNYSTFNDRTFIKNPENAIQITFAAPVANIAPVEEFQHSKKIESLKRPHTSYLILRNRLTALYERNLVDGGAFNRLCDQLSIILFDNPGQVKFFFKESKGPEIKISMQMGADVPKDISLYGSGTLQLLEILLNIHEKKTEANLVLLDEPDSHIHRLLQSRLLRVLNASQNTQVFITTHNEALIREANPEWIFHLEANPEKVYYPIQRNRAGNKGLISSAHSTVIQTLSGKGNGLDFVNALESDILFLVEGVNDALRIQKLLSLKNNDLRKYSFWVMGNLDTILDQITHYKNVFSAITNEKTLWEKSVLIFDKDCLTSNQRDLLLKNFAFFDKKSNKQNKTHIWRSYCFDCVLFSDLNLLSIILSDFIGRIKPEEDLSQLSKVLKDEINTLIKLKNTSEHIEAMVLDTYAEICKRRKKFESLKFTNPKIIKEDFHLKEDSRNYISKCLSVQNIHEIMNKDECGEILRNVFAKYSIEFSMEWINDDTYTLNDLFNSVNSSTIYDDWDFIMKL